ncbi:hypothetical protein NliqN6_5946 [Naganishia liquefaciens]|uniref:Uncharacterized protein n=1 Tax=Naganishia liquefaciens TaxID=104408 RepID=A0A8H3YH72_9TREE|nr:hypothetical protein NliqN6_5946 [Naganishia liquefaciens]
MTDKFNQTVRDIIVDLSQDTGLPFRIEHWNVRGQYRSLGLFAAKSTKHSAIAKASQEERGNAELLWSTTTGKRHDCVFESEWSEDSAAARSTGWWWKKHFVNEDRHHTTNERIWLKARFAIRGRLMFANHKPTHPFTIHSSHGTPLGTIPLALTRKVSYRPKVQTR